MREWGRFSFWKDCPLILPYRAVWQLSRRCDDLFFATLVVKNGRTGNHGMYRRSELFQFSAFSSPNEPIDTP